MSIIELTKIADFRGNLCFAEEGKDIPFDIKSVLWANVSNTANITLKGKAFLIALDGKLQIQHSNENRTLSTPNQGVMLNNVIDLNLSKISSKATVLILMDQQLGSTDTSSINNKTFSVPKINIWGLDAFFANSNNSVPFDIKRIYFTYNIPSFSKRGGHAHRDLSSLIFAIKGAFDIHTQTSDAKKTARLNSPQKGHYLQPGTWRELSNFKDESIVLVLASDIYKESDYIRNYRDFELEYSPQA